MSRGPLKTITVGSEAWLAGVQIRNTIEQYRRSPLDRDVDQPAAPILPPAPFGELCAWPFPLVAQQLLLLESPDNRRSRYFVGYSIAVRIVCGSEARAFPQNF